MVTIAALTAADLAEWTPLWQGYLAYYRKDLDPAITSTSFGRLVAGDRMVGGDRPRRRGPSGRVRALAVASDHLGGTRHGLS